jgi:hypothetical protein
MHVKTIHFFHTQNKAMDSQENITVITAECLCKAHTFSTSVLTSQLPLEGNVCHCNSCRHSTGALYVIDVTWPQPRNKMDISGLQTYQFSKEITYRFCGTCSAPMFYDSQKDPGELGVFSGALKNIDTDLIKLTEHIYVEDTIDGGGSVWLKRPNADDKEIPRFRERSGELSWDWPQVSTSTVLKDKREQGSVPIWCHCKGVEMVIHRGNYAAKKREDLPWFIDPRTNKPVASFDVCDSCRMQFGSDTIYWTFTELINISQADGGAYPTKAAELKAAVDSGDSAVGTLAYYQSSPDVQRYFCKVCSASVFYACDDRPEMVDVAIGLLEAPDGARAEEFLSWTLGETPSWVNDIKGGWREGLANRIQAQAEEFRVATDHPKSWTRDEKEVQADSS